ncbi:SLA1 (YBL007C) [Zygosaccharomyces parabailii]|nr:SLA1 (YBL007C) [Zygosaccharomyces parabailii]CDH15412.1 related to Actin cytoskeleton-regulatory complex protein SLA1 [Zygosaccharomyces bailii ISA1307]
MTVFIGVVKALYDYEPQTDEELAIQENDLLYLLQKSDVDDWWTVKKRVIGLDAEEPTGLVPSNYVEPAAAIRAVKAIYDYEEAQNPDEEITFHENELFDVFDDQDPDWLLVQSKSSGSYGFIPGNYVEPASGAAPAVEAASAQPVPIAPPAAPSVAPTSAAPVAAVPAPAPIAPPVMSPAGVTAFPPPPQHPTRAASASPKVVDDSPKLPARSGGSSREDPPLPARPRDDQSPPLPSRNDGDFGDIPPAKPARPTSTGGLGLAPPGVDSGMKRESFRSGSSYREGDDDFERDRSNGRGVDAHDASDHNDSYENRGLKTDYHTWSISEVDGRKKHKCKLTVGNNKVYFEPSTGPHEEWTIDKLTSYDSEKKHIFLDFVDPYKSLELHAGSNDTCAEIMTVFGEFKGAQRDPAFREIEAASKPKRQGKVLYDFAAESKDELTVKEGQLVYIVNDKKSKDWWMCELVSDGKRGVVPSQFIEPVKEKGSSSGGGFLGSLRKITGNTEKYNARQASRKGRSGGGSSNWRDDEAQSLSEASADKRNAGRRRSTSSSARRPSTTASKSEFPDAKKCRIWADRSGSFKVEAQFIGCTEGKIHLHKANGVKIAVAAEKLSDEDLIYVERATGFSLDKFKSKESGGGDSRNERDRSERERRRRGTKEQDDKEHDRWLREKELEELRKARELLDEERARLREAEQAPPPKPPRPQSTGSAKNVSLNYQPKYDWFEFFLNCGVDVSNCQRYTINFEREQLTEDMMKDINEPMLRTLGLREGDIVRVMKYLNNKFNREPQVAQGQSTGGMFSEADGSLKVANSGAPIAPQLTQNLLPQATGLQVSNNASAAVSSAPAPMGAPIQSAPTVSPAPAGPVSAAPTAGSSGQGAEDDAWAAKPAAKAEANSSNNNAEFTGSMQDLIDLRPLEPKKKEYVSAPEPKLKDLEPVKTGTDNTTAALPATLTGGTTLQPINPFKTGGNNLLPITTGFVMMPIATGGIMPMQRTGGIVMPQTTFGAQATGGIMQPQRTNSGLVSMGLQATGSIMQPQNTNAGLLPMGTGTALPPQNTILPSQSTGIMLPVGTGSVLQPQRTNSIFPTTTNAGMMPQTTFGAQPIGSTMPMQATGSALPRLGSVLPVQKTGSGLMPVQGTGSALPMQTTGGILPMQRTGGLVPLQRTGGLPMQVTGNLVPLQRTGGLPMQVTGNPVPLQRTGMMPQTSFGANITGGANMMPQTSFTRNITGGANIISQTTFNGPAMTAAPNMMPQTSFGGPNMTGGANMLPQNSFGGFNVTGGPNIMPQTSFGGLNPNVGGNMVSQNSFGGGQMTGGANMMPQTSFGGPQMTGGFQQNSYNNQGAPAQMQQTNGFSSMPQQGQMSGSFQQSNPAGPPNQFTGGPMQQSFPNTSFNSAVDNATQGMQDMSFSQAPLQSQPTGFGFGNGPQQQSQQQQQPKQANLFNATADNPFGF